MKKSNVQTTRHNLAADYYVTPRGFVVIRKSIRLTVSDVTISQKSE